MPPTLTSPPPVTATPSDFLLLVARIRAGDELALERLLAAVAVPMRRIAESYIGSSLQPHVDADDLVQRVALILWHGLRTLRTGKFVVATPQQLMALARTLLKRQAARAVQQFKPAMEATTNTGEFDLSATIVDQPVNAPAKKADASEQIQQLMKRVSADDRRMLKLLLLGHSIADAARLLEIEPAALRMRLSRLRVRVRKVHHIRVRVSRVQRDVKVEEPKVAS